MMTSLLFLIGCRYVYVTIAFDVFHGIGQVSRRF